MHAETRNASLVCWYPQRYGSLLSPPPQREAGASAPSPPAKSLASPQPSFGGGFRRGAAVAQQQHRRSASLASSLAPESPRASTEIRQSPGKPPTPAAPPRAHTPTPPRATAKPLTAAAAPALRKPSPRGAAKDGTAKDPDTAAARDVTEHASAHSSQEHTQLSTPRSSADHTVAAADESGSVAAQSNPATSAQGALQSGKWWSDADEPVYCIVSRAAIVCARPRDADDQVRPSLPDMNGGGLAGSYEQVAMDMAQSWREHNACVLSTITTQRCSTLAHFKLVLTYSTSSLHCVLRSSSFLDTKGS